MAPVAVLEVIVKQTRLFHETDDVSSVVKQLVGSAATHTILERVNRKRD
jgi:hypothetical protein